MSRDDDERALVGRGQRAAERASTASERRLRKAIRSQASSPSSGVPDMVERQLGAGYDDLGGREITEPWEILDSDLLPAEAEIVKRSKRPSGDPLTVEDGAKMLRRIIRKELDDRSTEKRRADEYLAIIDTTPSGKLAGRVGALEKRTKFWNRVLWIVAIAIGGGLLQAANRIWDRSAHETALEYELKDARKDNVRQDDENKRQDKEIEYLKRRLERDDRRDGASQQHSSPRDNQP